MTLFYVGVALLVILTLLFVLWPIITQSRHREQDVTASDSVRQSTNVALYHDHLADIQSSLASGSITQEQFDALNAELERNLLEDSAVSSGDHESGAVLSVNRRKPVVFFSLLLLIVLVAAALLYGRLGAYSSWQVKQALDERYALEQDFVAADASQQGQLQAKIIVANQRLITRLKADVSNHPDNLQTRALLARTTAGMGDYPTAIEQFKAILELESEGVSSIRAELAQALFLQMNNSVSPEVQSLVDEVLVEDPNNTVGLSLSGIGAFQSEDYATAISFWEKMIAIEGANSPNSIALQQGINTARQRMAAAGQVSDTASTASTLSASQPESVTSGPQIPVMVSLGEGVTAAPEATVFIYARAWQGMKAPLSIARMQVKDLPVTLLLNNSMSMAPSMNLNTAAEFELVARISPSGSPVPQAGDWQVTLGPVTAVTADNVSSAHQLIIGSQLP
ncbi:Cytochrome c heme lyase subunit CcmH [gamma proteobacterium IMCC1989]|nr:Cytochrome c heme lyase subunit CcmH [gamma proteobacterium IMCC1989]